MDLSKAIEDLRGYFNKTILGSEQQVSLRSILDILAELNERQEKPNREIVVKLLEHSRRIGDIASESSQTHQAINDSFHDCEARITSNDEKIAKLDEQADNIDTLLVRHKCDDDRHITTAKEEKINRCPNYGCNECFRRTIFYLTPGEAFEAWQAGDND